MMSFCSRIFLFLFLSIVCLYPVSLFAQTVSELEAQIQAHNEKIRQIDREIAEYQRQLNVIGSEKQTLQNAIRTLDISRSQTQSQINGIQQKISAANLRLRELSYEIGDTEKSISLSRESLAKTIRAQAKSDDLTLIEMVFGSEDLGEAWKSIDALQVLGNALREHTQTLTSVKQTLDSQHKDVDETKQELVAHSNNLGAQKKALDINKQSKQTLLKDTQNQESAYQRLIEQKKAEQAAFESAIFELSSRIQFAIDPTKIPASGSGVLEWPLDSVFITQQFGKTASSGRLYASGTHNGVDFRASIGTPVKASLSGTVSYVNHGSAPNCQYGKWVLITHGNGLATLYAHLSSIAVKAGESVVTGQVIGNSGMTGYATGPHLHLTVFLSEAVQYSQFTCRSGAVVTIPVAPVNAYLNPLAYL